MEEYKCFNKINKLVVTGQIKKEVAWWMTTTRFPDTGVHTVV